MIFAAEDVSFITEDISFVSEDVNFVLKDMIFITEDTNFAPKDISSISKDMIFAAEPGASVPYPVAYTLYTGAYSPSCFRAASLPGSFKEHGCLSAVGSGAAAAENPPAEPPRTAYKGSRRIFAEKPQNRLTTR